MSVCYEVSGAKMAAPASQASQEKKDIDYLEKLIKFFALKSAQVIVQARLGGTVETKCNPDSTQDWFNLAIKDLPEVLSEAKKAMASSGSRLPMCVEISLRTNDQETMTLETWCIGMRKDMVDPFSNRACHTLYIRMGILLKSLVTLTRVTPAYKLSRNKSDYVMCYRIYVGEPQLYSLGTDYQQMKVGQIGTSLGTLNMSLAYRTKLTISPQHTKNSCMMVKSDHFRPDSSPADNIKNCSDLGSLFDQPVKLGAFADRLNLPKPEPVDFPFSNLMFPPRQSPRTASPPVPPAAATTGNSSSGGGSTGSAGAGRRTNDNTTADSYNGNVTPHSEEPFELLPDLIFPFASSNANTELSMFYRECMRAPQLQTFVDETVEEQIGGDLTKQLEVFETSLQEYDNILTSVCHGENNN